MVVLRALHEVAWNYRREVDNRYAHKGQRDRGTRWQVQVVQMKNECPACITPIAAFTVPIYCINNKYI